MRGCVFCVVLFVSQLGTPNSAAKSVGNSQQHSNAGTCHPKIPALLRNTGIRAIYIWYRKLKVYSYVVVSQHYRGMWHFSTGTKNTCPRKKRKNRSKSMYPRYAYSRAAAAAAAKKARDRRTLLDPSVSHRTGPHRLVSPCVPCCSALWSGAAQQQHASRRKGTPL